VRVQSFFLSVSSCLYSLTLVSGFTRWLVSLALLASTSPLCGVYAGYGAALRASAPRPNLCLPRRVLKGREGLIQPPLKSLPSVGLRTLFRGASHYN
jgi:hypothetical protein